MADNKETVRKVEEAWDRGDLDSLDQYFAPDFTPHTAVPGMPPGLAGAKAAHQGAVQAFPDRHVEIVDLLGDGDSVAVRCRMTGTNEGGLPWLGIPANGKPVDIEWISIYRVDGGRIAEHWAVMDVLGLMQQLGAIPQPA